MKGLSSVSTAHCLTIRKQQGSTRNKTVIESLCEGNHVGGCLMQCASDRSRCNPSGPACWRSFHVPAGRPCCLQVSGPMPFLLLSRPHCQGSQSVAVTGTVAQVAGLLLNRVSGGFWTLDVAGNLIRRLHRGEGSVRHHGAGEI